MMSNTAGQTNGLEHALWETGVLFGRDPVASRYDTKARFLLQFEGTGPVVAHLGSCDRNDGASRQHETVSGAKVRSR